MITGASIDFSGMAEDLRQMYAVMIGNGHGETGDLNRVAEIEAGQMAWDISMALGPATKEGAKKYIERDLKQYLTDKPRYLNLSADQQESSAYSEFRWLYAGPNFLVGINMEDDRTDAGVAEALQFVRAGQKTGSRGKAWEHLGNRGRQHILRLNRTRVSRSTLSGAYRQIRDTLVGEMRATFASAAKLLLPAKRVPGWVEEKIAQVEAKGKTHFAPMRGEGSEAYLEFGSHAKGVESNPKVREKIQGAVDQRRFKLNAKIQKLIQGYTYDFENGRVFKSRANELEDVE